MRGVPRWVAVLAVVAIVTMVCAFTMHRAFAPAAFLVETSPATIPVEGFASTQLTLHSTARRDLRGLRVEVDDPHRAAIDSVAFDHDSAVISLRAGVLPGETKIQLTAAGFAPLQVALRTTLDVSDTVGDGTPDRKSTRLN